jgi:4-oxalocrotonate tautomerase
MARSGEAVAAAALDDPRRSSIEQGGHMPLVQVKVIEGVFSPDQKRQIVEGVTEAMVAVEGEAMRGVTWVLVEEVLSGDWGIGGRALTTGDVQALAAGAPA